MEILRFDELLKDLINNQDDIFGAKTAGSIVSPSRICQCIRKLYLLQILDKKEEINYDSLFRMNLGSGMHKYFEEFVLKLKELEKNGTEEQKDKYKKWLKGFEILEVEKYVEIPFPIPMRGYYDISFMRDGVKFIGDYKFITNTNSFEKLSTPHEKYMDQLYLYGYIERVEDLCLIYYDAFSGRSRVFEFKVDYKRIGELKVKMNYLKKCLEEKEEPDIPEIVPECSYCEFKSRCWKK